MNVMRVVRLTSPIRECCCMPLPPSHSSCNGRPRGRPPFVRQHNCTLLLNASGNVVSLRRAEQRQWKKHISISTCLPTLIRFRTTVLVFIIHARLQLPTIMRLDGMDGRADASGTASSLLHSFTFHERLLKMVLLLDICCLDDNYYCVEKQVK